MHALACKLDLPVRAVTPRDEPAEAGAEHAAREIAARNRQPFLVMEDLSAPIMVKGRHWGAFRFGLKV